MRACFVFGKGERECTGIALLLAATWEELSNSNLYSLQVHCYLAFIGVVVKPYLFFRQKQSGTELMICTCLV
jgi:hypothetical protein